MPKGWKKTMKSLFCPLGTCWAYTWFLSCLMVALVPSPLFCFCSIVSASRNSTLVLRKSRRSLFSCSTKHNTLVSWQGASIFLEQMCPTLLSYKTHFHIGNVIQLHNPPTSFLWLVFYGVFKNISFPRLSGEIADMSWAWTRTHSDLIGGTWVIALHWNTETMSQGGLILNQMW